MRMQDLTPMERMLLLAKLYHNMWYDEKRYNFILEVLEDFEEHPVKEAKFLNQIDNNGTETELR